MSETDIELGPIDWVIVEWPPGKEPNGKGLDMIVDLTERDAITAQALITEHLEKARDDLLRANSP